MAAVVLEEVRKSFGRSEVIKGVTTQVRDGELRVVLGPSGCGKSTILRMIAGLEEISGGTIRIGERVVNRLEPKDRDIAMVFQNYALYPHMRVFDNMAYGLRNQGMAKPEIERRVTGVAKTLGLEALLTRRPRELSGGQRQRVAMGRAMVREPAVFLFDEPLSNLDAKLRVQMRIEIKQLQQRLGTTGIYVTHDQVEAMTLGDQLMVMNAGVVEQTGPPLEVYERPASVFVGGFIGSPSMNFLAARIEDGMLVVGEDRLPLQEPWSGHAGRAVTLGIRPEHLHLAHEARGAPHLHLGVALVETLGADTVVHGRIAGSDQALAVRLAGTSRVAADDQLTLTPDLARLHLFDPATGRRLDVRSRSDLA
jgi:sn-glycerol 3-phosphate transport system ATP-binding protein